MAVKTRKVAGRRSLHFDTLSDILREVESLDGSAHTAMGNWTPAQIVQHLTKVIRMALDGIEYRAPWPIPIIMRLFKKSMLSKPMKPGFNLPGRFRVLEPDEDVNWEDAVAALRTVIGEIKNGRRIDKPSPLFGPMRHEEWVDLHCRHAELHLSFIAPTRDDGHKVASIAQSSSA